MIKCPNCWAENKPNAKFCKNCGAPLGDESNTPATTKATTIMGTSTQTQGRSKKKAVWGISAAVVALALIGLYFVGRANYSKDKQLAEISTAMKNTSQDLSPYVTTDDSSFEVSSNSVLPLQKYYQAHPSKANELISSFQSSAYVPHSKDKISLVTSGRYFLIYPKYKLMVKTYKPTVKTNMPGVLYVDGTKTAKLASGATKLPSSYIFGNYSFKLVGPQHATKTAKAAVDGNTTVDLTLDSSQASPSASAASAASSSKASKASSASSASSASAHSSSRSSRPAEGTKNDLWSSDQNDELGDDFDDESEDDDALQDQSYDFHYMGDKFDTVTSGRFPAAFKSATVGGSPVSMGWSWSSDSTYDYRVVAVFNDDDDEVTYVFAFNKANHPVVLVDTGANHDAENHTYSGSDGKPNFNVSQNQAAKNAFNDAIND